jgi:hypothetical protein
MEIRWVRHIAGMGRYLHCHSERNLNITSAIKVKTPFVSISTNNLDQNKKHFRGGKTNLEKKNSLSIFPPSEHLGVKSNLQTKLKITSTTYHSSLKTHHGTTTHFWPRTL